MFEFEYLEDKSGRLTLEQILSNSISDSFKPYPGFTVTRGHKPLKLVVQNSTRGEVPGIDSSRYISINNAYTEKIVLYYPMQNLQPQNISYKRRWHFEGEAGDEGFLYPVFRLPESQDSPAIAIFR